MYRRGNAFAGNNLLNRRWIPYPVGCSPTQVLWVFCSSSIRTGCVVLVHVVAGIEIGVETCPMLMGVYDAS